MTSIALQAARQAFQEYRDGVEAWRIDHRRAMACYELEDLLATGSAVYQLFVEVHRNWQDRINEGLTEYSEDDNEIILGHFARWLQQCDEPLAEIARLEKAGYSVRGAKTFREQCQDAKKRTESGTEAEQLRSITPSPDRLRELAERYPPDASWFDNDEACLL